MKEIFGDDGGFAVYYVYYSFLLLALSALLLYFIINGNFAKKNITSRKERGEENKFDFIWGEKE